MSSLMSVSSKDDDVSTRGITHDSKSSVLVKRHNNMPSVDCNNSLHQNSIAEDGQEDDTAVQNGNQGLTLDDNYIGKCDRLMKAKVLK